MSSGFNETRKNPAFISDDLYIYMVYYIKDGILLFMENLILVKVQFMLTKVFHSCRRQTHSMSCIVVPHVYDLHSLFCIIFFSCHVCDVFCCFIVL